MPFDDASNKQYEIESILQRIATLRLDMRISRKNIQYQEDIIAQDMRQLNEYKRMLYRLDYKGVV